MSLSVQKIAILGASRGLGRALALQIQATEPAATLFLAARKEIELKKVARTNDVYVVADFTNVGDQTRLLSGLFEYQPTTIFYVAGGGPFGDFEKKAFKDHQWAFDLNFVYPAKLVHEVLTDPKWASYLKQFVWIGSAIAGQKPDPQAASYAAAKHAARGLVTSLQKEAPKKIAVELYEPGYLDTDLLPAKAWPREQGLVKSVKDEARDLWHWAQSRLR